MMSMLLECLEYAIQTAAERTEQTVLREGRVNITTESSSSTIRVVASPAQRAPLTTTSRMEVLLSFPLRSSIFVSVASVIPMKGGTGNEEKRVE